MEHNYFLCLSFRPLRNSLYKLAGITGLFAVVSNLMLNPALDDEASKSSLSLRSCLDTSVKVSLPSASDQALLSSVEGAN